MELTKERVMAYELARDVDLNEEEISGGFSFKLPTLQPSCVDTHNFDMEMDK